jgi:prolyl-tRNA synthetase
MKYSKLFGKTSKNVPSDETSVNAKLLIKAGFIRKEMAGVYNFLPLGLRVLNKISKIIREEMESAGGQEILMVSLQNKSNWEKTGRWEGFDALFKLKSRHDNEYALGPTHEEVLVPMAKNLISSYKDLPLSIYQIQNKFRDEARSKAGLLRGREFLMKDLYSFHSSEKDLMDYYEEMKKVYKKTFSRMGLDAIETRASGGTFSKFSHEYQVICENGEDEIIYCPGGDFSENTEITDVPEGKQCDLGHGPLKKVKTIEVGNIFPLNDKFSKPFGLKFKDKDGSEKDVMMGCYGIGVSRAMGTIVEVYNDEKGIAWPESVAPFSVHLIVLGNAKKGADKVYSGLQKAGIEVLYDDREDAQAGEKFADADLIGVPVRLVVSEKTGDKIEFKKRKEEKSELLSIEEVIKKVGKGR